jgi:hypothetical protein
MKLDRQDLGLSKIVSKDSYRPNLQNIVLRNGHLIVTDGYILAYRPATMSTPTETYTDDVAIPVEVVKKLAKPAKGVIELTVGEKLTVKYPLTTKWGAPVGDNTAYEVSFQQGQKGLAIDLDKLMELRPGDTTTVVNFSTENLRKILSVLDSDDKIRFRIVTNRPTAPIEFAAMDEDRQIRGVVMPYVADPNFKWNHPT